MLDLLYIIEIVLFFLICITYLSYCFAVYKLEARNKRCIFYILVILMAVGVIVSFLDETHKYELELIVFIIMPFIVYSNYKISLLNSLKLTLAAIVKISLFTCVTEHILSILLRDIISHEKNLLLITYFILFSMIWVLYGFGLKRLPQNAFIPTGGVWIVTFVFFTIITIMISNHQYLTGMYYDENRVAFAGAVVVGIGGIIVFFIYHILLYYINSSREYRTNLFFSKKFNEQQNAYFKELLKKENETRRFRHDYRSQLMVIHSLIEKDEIESLKKYCQQLCENKVVIEQIYSVRNEIADIILNYYLKSIQENASIVVLGSMPAEILSETETTIIISNLIRNSVEELNNVVGEKFLLFESRYEGGELMIRTRNTVSENTLLELNKRGLKGSSKGEEHFGIGIKNIKDIVKKYDGNFEWRVKGNFLWIEIRIFR